MVCAGASELAMSQWASTFAEAGLKVSKTVGDLGCSSGPTVVGMVANAFDGKLTWGILCAILFPIVMLLGLWRMTNKGNKA